MNDPQLDAQGRLRHLLTLKDMPRGLLERLLERAETLLNYPPDSLAGLHITDLIEPEDCDKAKLFFG